MQRPLMPGRMKAEGGTPSQYVRKASIGLLWVVISWTLVGDMDQEGD